MRGRFYQMMYWVPAILLMFGIFYYSHQPAAESARLSGGISGRIVEFVNQAAGKPWKEKMCRVYAEKLDYPIRKAAHMAEYALLGMAFLFALAGGKNDITKRMLLFAFIFSVCYAATDEFHQLFVSGRAGRISDVFLDGTGSALGIVIPGRIIIRHLMWVSRRE